MLRLLTLLIALSLIAPATAAAQRTTAPPGNSGIDEYLETVPAGAGNKPVKPRRGDRGSLPPKTVRALEAQGPDGVLAAELAAATAPESASERNGASGSGSSGGGSAGSGTSGTSGAPAIGRADGGSPVGSVVEAVVGAGGGSGGTGLLLPALLLATLAVGIATVVTRRRLSN